MSLKTVLAPVSGNDADAAILDAAHAIALPHGAHVFVAHTYRDPRDTLMPGLGMGMSTSMVEAVVEQAQGFAEKAASAARAAYNAWRQKHDLEEVAAPVAGAGVTVSFESLAGEPAVTVAGRARMVDVTCVIAPAGGESSDAPAIAEAALLRSGKAAIVVPRDVTMSAVRTLAIGWNASKEAATAVAHAMPLMETADRVLVMAGLDSELTEAKLATFVESLQWHGIKAERKSFDASSGSISGRLQAEAREAGAQLLVLGAYSHSRMREAVFGGVTDDILRETRLPVLMAH